MTPLYHVGAASLFEREVFRVLQELEIEVWVL